MQTQTLLLFGAAVLPLVITPGPDMLFVISQGLSGGCKAALKADAGILMGYATHAVLAATGVAAIIAACPALFEILRWAGVCYLACLAVRMILSALRPRELDLGAAYCAAVYRRAFMSSFLNPKTLLVYFAILPNFISPNHSVASQAAILSLLFVALCGIVYGLAGVTLAAAATNGRWSRRRGQYLHGVAGGLLIVSAARIAAG